MTYSEIKYLIALYEMNAENEGVKQVELAKALTLTKVSVFKGADKLILKNLAYKENNGLIHLTEKGKTLAEKYIRCSKEVNCFLIEHLNSRPCVSEKDSLKIVCTLSQENFEKLHMIASLRFRR